jgi:hypothetical protein
LGHDRGANWLWLPLCSLRTRHASQLVPLQTWVGAQQQHWHYQNPFRCVIVATYPHEHHLVHKDAFWHDFDNIILDTLISIYFNMSLWTWGLKRISN